MPPRPVLSVLSSVAPIPRCRTRVEKRKKGVILVEPSAERPHGTVVAIREPPRTCAPASNQLSGRKACGFDQYVPKSTHTRPWLWDEI